MIPVLTIISYFMWLYINLLTRIYVHILTIISYFMWLYICLVKNYIYCTFMNSGMNHAIFYLFRQILNKKDNSPKFQINCPFTIYMFYIFVIILSQENFLFSHVPAVQTVLSAVCLPQSFHDP